MRIRPVLLIAVLFVMPFRSSFATSQVGNNELRNQTNPRVDRYLASYTVKKKADWKWESKEAIQ
ncbi:MAG TPA: hypothetical protein VFS90_04990 [Pyrinomonadaceae bacterium]|nr:hypothetical protein [Pyrinomonadaceae bacterium]